MVRRVAAAVAVVIAIFVVWPAAASAHEKDATSVLLDIGDTVVAGTIRVPADALKAAVELPADGTSAEVAAFHKRVITYLADHITVTGDDGARWRVELGVPSFTSAGDHLDVPVTFVPAGGTVSDFTLRYDALVELLTAHEIRVAAGADGGERRLLGVLDSGRATIEIREDGTTTAGFWTMVHHGFEHVRAGADHLLFLLVLLLPAPLVVAAGRWQPGGSAWRTLRRVVHVVTAFTIGHSITLVASALGWVNVPSQPVEILIAISVGAGAVHAVRPLIGSREAVIAATFGLVHGLAFAGILDDLGLGGSTAVGSLLGFNIGIELAQLAAVALVFPSLYALSRTDRYSTVRVGGAGLALVFAAAWVADRASWIGNPLQGIEDAAVANPFAIAGGLALVAAVTVVVKRLSTVRPTSR